MARLSAEIKAFAETLRPSTFPSGIVYHASGLSQLALNPSYWLEENEVPKLEDAQPGRLAEHERAWSVLSVAASVLLALGTLALCLYRFRAGALRAKLATEMDRLLTRGDLAWVALGSVIVPFAAMECLVRFTPLAGWDWGLGVLRGIRPGMAMLLLLWMLFMLPVFVARWRIGRRLGFAGIRWKRSWLGWLTLVLLLGLLLSGIWTTTADPDVSTTTCIVAITFTAVVLLSLSTAAASALFSKREKLLQRAVLARTVRPAWAAAALLLAAGAVHARTRETWWSQHDLLLRPDPAEPALTRTEYRSARFLRERLLEVWNSPR